MDTTPEIEAMQFAFYRSAPGWRKLAMMSSLNRSVRTLAMSGLRSRHPHASPEELRYLLAELLYGSEIAEKIRSINSAADGLDNGSSGISGGNQ